MLKLSLQQVLEGIYVLSSPEALSHLGFLGDPLHVEQCCPDSPTELEKVYAMHLTVFIIIKCHHF